MDFCYFLIDMAGTPLRPEFEILEIWESPRTDRLPMGTRLRATIKGGWPVTSFILMADPMYRTYNTSGNPSELFEKASGWLIHMKEMELNDEKEVITEREVAGTMCRTTFGSNHIERFGLDIDMTMNLCRQIFGLR